MSLFGTIFVLFNNYIWNKLIKTIPNKAVVLNYYDWLNEEIAILYSLFYF